MRVLVTGAAGFIGMHTCVRLIKDGFTVYGLDNLNNYYSTDLKKKRILEIQKFYPSFKLIEGDLTNFNFIKDVFKQNKFEIIIHMAAQAGVRLSVEKPKIYLDTNISGFFNLIEVSKDIPLKHFLYASSSSVYGMNDSNSYHENINTDRPLSMYAVSKKTNELIAYSYSNLYNIPMTGLRFFTVYGPWGRPDMALFSFTKAIIDEKPIDIYNNGNMKRDFTYIDDVVESIIRLVNLPPKQSLEDTSNVAVPHRILNIGCGKPVNLNRFLELIELELGKRAIKNYKPIQSGEVYITKSDTKKLHELTNFKPQVDIETGIKNFIEWYKFHFNI